ncbi:MAG: hypothetical protein ACRBFS_23020 [Aureispira sp.]
MNKEIVKYYCDAWFKVVYTEGEVYLNFKAYKIEGLDEENLENSDVEEEHEVEGEVRYDGLMNIKANQQYVNLDYAHQTYLMIKHVEKFNEKYRNDKWESKRSPEKS